MSLIHIAAHRPKLRWPLVTEHLEHEGQRYLLLKDQYGIASQPALVPLPLVAVLSRFDGATSIENIVHEGATFGLTLEIALRLADDLAALGFLDTEETRTRVRLAEQEFLNNPVRPEALAGAIYPADPEELRTALKGYINGVERTFSGPKHREEIIGMICPHIDYARGWKTYASAYSALEHIKRPDVIFLLGTSHYGGTSIYQLSRKDFRTPIGTFPAAQDVIDRLCAVIGSERLFQDEYLHKREHSLELQLPFLAHRYGVESLPRLVPILVGSFHSFLVEQHSPLENPEVADFVGTLAEVTKQLRMSGQRVLYYGGVDLAHVGLHFGDHERFSDSKLNDIRVRDQELLDTILASNEDRLFKHVAEDCDKRRICGFPSMYTMLAALRRAGIRLNGHFIEYRQAVEPKTDCVVTFASACWTVE